VRTGAGAPASSLPRGVVSLFCRHNRFTADCPICSRGTVLEPETGGRRERRGGERRAEASAGVGADRTPRSRAPQALHGATPYRGRFGVAGPYERDGERVEVRLERVPGGLRLGEWSAGRLAPRAPVASVRDLDELARSAAAAGAVGEPERDDLVAAVTAAREPAAEDGASHGSSPGRSGELREELRVERVDDEHVRVARWILRPGTGWEMRDAPPMLPAPRYVEALRDAARRGLLAS
jgi:hypothetical protein